MEFWTSLGIPQTKDKDAITAAYHEKLKLTNPEDNQEEFMELRRCFEQAIKYAEAEESDGETEVDTPVDKWVQRVAKVYNEYFERMNPECWVELLRDDVCNGIDSRLAARDKLLAFFMENYYMPKEIWQLLDKHFSLIESLPELYDKFPKNFIDNIIVSGVDNDNPAVPYELFSPETKGNPDGYFHLYFKANRELNDVAIDAAAATIEDIERSGIEHAFTVLLKTRLMRLREDNEGALSLIEEFCAKYPANIDGMYQKGVCYTALKRNDEGAEVFSKLLEVCPEHYAGSYFYAKALIELGELEKAKSIINKWLRQNPYDSSFVELCNNVNKLLDDKFSHMLECGTLDIDKMIDYAWVLLQNDEPFEKIEAIMSKIMPETPEQRCDYENVLTKSYLHFDKTAEALEHSEVWLKGLDELPEGETEKEKRRKNKKCEILNIQAMALFRMDKDEEGEQRAREAIEADPNETQPHTTLFSHYFSKSKYGKAATEAEALVRLQPGSARSYASLAAAQCELGRDLDAFDNYGKAIDCDRSDLGLYIRRTLILLDHKQIEGAQEIIDFLEKAGVDADSLSYCKARVKYLNGEKGEAVRVYRELINNSESEQSDIKYILHRVCYSLADYENDNSNNELSIELIDKGLDNKENDLSLLRLKGFVLRDLGRMQEAVDTFTNLNELYPDRVDFHSVIGDILYEIDEYEKALENYIESIKLGETAQLHKMIALCNMYLKNYEQADEHNKRAIEHAPNDIRIRTNYGMMFERRFEFEKALEIHKQAMELYEKVENDPQYRNRYSYSSYARALARAGRRDEAIEVFKKYAALYNDADDYMKVVELYMEKGEPVKAEKAMRDWQKCAGDKANSETLWHVLADIEDQKGNSKGYYANINKLDDKAECKLRLLGDYWLEKGKYDKAIQFFKKHDEKYPDSVNHLTGLAECYILLGDTAEAKACLQRQYKNLEPDAKLLYREPLYLTKMAFALILDGRLEEAKEYIDKAFAAPMCNTCKYSICKDAYGALGRYYNALGDYESAFEAYTKGREAALDDTEMVFELKRLEKKLGKRKNKKRKGEQQ